MKNGSHNINRIVNIFALEAFSFLYYTKHHWLHGNFTDMVSSAHGRSLFVLFLLTISYCLCFWLSLWYLQTFLKIICFLPLFPRTLLFFINSWCFLTHSFFPETNIDRHSFPFYFDFFSRFCLFVSFFLVANQLLPTSVWNFDQINQSNKFYLKSKDL